MISKLKKFLRGEGGITGLETAIILIAFVVVAAVFAFTVLSAGVFSADKGKEAVYSGLAEVSGSMEVVGSIIAYGDTTADYVTTVAFSLSNVAGGEPIDLTEPTDADDDGEPDTGSGHKVVIDYHDENNRYTDISWAAEAMGDNDNDVLLEPGEMFEITVGISATEVAPALGVDTIFVIEVKPPTGGILVLERTTPPTIDVIMDLH